MPTKAEILQKYKDIHDNLTKQFYTDKAIDKATFAAEHEKCWKDMEAELLANGYLQRRYSYFFGATIQTAIGDVEVKVAVASPVELTPTQTQNNIDKLKTADWHLVDTKEDLVEA
jgi:hypothetical protein